MMNMIPLSLVVVILFFLARHNAFIPKPPLLTRFKHNLGSSLSSSCLFSSKEENLEDMRRLLEASWNVDTMGAVPTNPEDAADGAADSINAAKDNGESLFFVDLLLPSYDISQGINMYDEVLAVEFCIALADSLEDKTCVLVRDAKTLNSVNRVLEARERNQLDEDEEEDDDDKEEIIIDIDDKDEEETEFYDDFADFGGAIGGEPDREMPTSLTTEDAAPKTTEDVDAFREQLMTKWDDPPAQKSEAPAKKSVEGPEAADFSSLPKPTNKEPAAAATPSKDRLYRLASLFGDARISTGSDMMDQVGKAVNENGKPTDDEETIIILSAVGKDEMIAVRSLAAKYKGNKNIVLVNCQLDPLPRELIGAKTVYSILPLVARPVVSDANVFGNEKPQDESETPPKVVVMRRYPKDWEVYVDADGNGFELADVVKASQIRGKKGPPMEWIAGCVKRHMESKLGGGR